MSEVVIRRLLRGTALAIAIAAVVDPSITSNRTVRPVIVVAPFDSTRDAALTDRVAKAIGKRFTVSRTPIAGASGAVVVGDEIPSDDRDWQQPVYAVVPDTSAPSVAIARIDAPAIVPFDARVPVIARIVVHGARGRTLEVALHAGPSIADQTTRRVTSADSVLDVPLSFVPTGAGASAVRVTATLSGAAPALADAAVDVRDRRWAVLFFDPRPSWSSTFVRRALERDARFVVTSRTVTSRNVSTDAGAPPRALSDPSSLSSFDAVVVGAPDALSSADVTGLDSFMRRRGGSVILLMDQRASGAYDRLTDVAAWGSANTTPMLLATPRRDSAALRAADLAWPAPLPPGAVTLAGGAHPVIWKSPVGAGRLIVSGALDAWRFRDSSASGFDRFWREAIAEAASEAPPAISLWLASSIVSPGAPVEVHATLRGAALATGANTVRASVAATLAPGTPIAMWPEGDLGQLTGTLRAPATPGVYRVLINADGATADARFVVARDVRRAAPPARDLVGLWARSRGGRVLSATQLEALPSALSAAVRPPSRAETRHPMRSGWWMVPFVLALSGEWVIRRRRGLR